MMSRKKLQATENSQFSHVSVLVVDHVDNIRSTVARMLSELGFKKVYQATNGSDALALMKKYKVDLILSESQMPKMDGVEFLRKIRRDTKTNKLPFVMTSANIEQAAVISAIKNGVSEYVVKPFSAKILMERIKTAISNPIKNTASFIKRQTNEKYPETEQKLKILIVDDVPDNINLISELLKSEYQLKAATNGELALKICASEKAPDLVLLDIMMPNMDGFEVCRRLKSNSATQHIAIIFLTAMDQSQDVVKGLELGAVDYVTKPIQPTVLKARVKTHSKVIKAQKQMREQVDTLMEMAQLKEKFERITQNDLKYPLQEISGSLNLLLDKHKDPHRVKQSATAIKCNLSKMSQMVDNMLSIGKIEEGNYQLNPVSLDVSKLVHDVISAHNMSYSTKSLDIQNDIPRSILIDGEELLTISLLSNLFKNAIEAAPRGSAIRLTVEKEAQFQTIMIRNVGSIPEEIYDTFFDKYVTSGKKNAAGIGTYAAKLMTEVQNGKINFISDDNKTSTLKVSLPAN